VVQDVDFIFYNNLIHPSGAVEHTGDNRTGEGEGDDEQIKINFSKVPSHIERIAITVTIHDAEARSQNFGQVSNAFVRVVDEQTENEILRFDLGEDFSVETAVVICELYRHNGDWKFNAIGSGFAGGLASLCRNFGLEV
jgi:tellurium resistance protein TerD